jgi:hypothetical protein
VSDKDLLQVAEELIYLTALNVAECPKVSTEGIAEVHSSVKSKNREMVIKTN